MENEWKLKCGFHYESTSSQLSLSVITQKWESRHVTEWDLTFKLLMLALLLITSGTLIHPSPKASKQTNKQTKLHNNPTNWKENCHLHYREELLCWRNAKKQNKQTNNQTIWWENHHCALPKRKTRESPCCRNETWLFSTANVSVIVNCRDGKTTELSAVLFR